MARSRKAADDWQLPDLLEAASERTQAKLRAAAIMHAVPAGSVVFEQGELPSFQQVVVTGSVQLYGRSVDGREVLIENVQAPELVIPAAVMTASPFLMRGRVPEPTRLILIHADVFRSAVSNDPALAHIVILSLAGQFRRMVRQIKNLKLRSTQMRVGCYILAQSVRQGTPHSARLPFEKHLIASELGMTRECFSRVLASLRQLGVMADGEVITIADPERLSAMCRPDPLIDGRDAVARCASNQAQGILKP